MKKNAKKQRQKKLPPAHRKLTTSLYRRSKVRGKTPLPGSITPRPLIMEWDKMEMKYRRKLMRIQKIKKILLAFVPGIIGLIITVILFKAFNLQMARLEYQLLGCAPYVISFFITGKLLANILLREK